MTLNSLGPLEELVLLTVASLGTGAYVILVKKELEKRTNRKANISAVHSTLHRLEEKGCLTSEIDKTPIKRPGRRKRYFYITNAGFEVLRKLKSLRESYWKTIPKLASEGM